MTKTDTTDSASTEGDTAPLYELPEGFADLDAEALGALAADIKALAADVTDRKESRDLLRAYAAAVGTVNSALTELAADAEADAALAAATPVVPTFSAADDDDADKDSDNDDDADKDDDKLSNSDDASDASGSLSDDSADDNASGSVAASGASSASNADKARAMAASRSKSMTPSVDNGARVVGFTASDGGGQLSMSELAQRITEERLGMGNHEGAPRKFKIGTASRTIGGHAFAVDTKANDRAFKAGIAKRVERSTIAASASPEAFAASGGGCAPKTPTFELFTDGEVQTNLQDWLDWVDGDRGGMRYTPPPATDFLGAGIQINPCDGSLIKPSVHVTACPTEEEVCVRAISKRVRFDNLNYRVYPELVEYMLHHTAILESAKVERFLLGRIDEEAGAATVLATNAFSQYGALRGTLGFIVAAADRHRRAKHMKGDTVIDMMAPDVWLSVLQSDMIRDLFQGGANAFHSPMVNVVGELLRRFKINLGTYFYNASDPANPDNLLAGFPDAEHRGANWAFPEQGRFYILSQGAIQGVDGGNLDVGLYRDSELNDTNDVELFAERWVEIAHVGSGIDSFDVPFLDNGAGPAGVAPIA